MSCASHAPSAARPRRLAIAAALALLAACAAARRPPAVLGLPPDDRSAPLSAVFVGHSTVLVRLGGRFVLTDPYLGGALYTQTRMVPASLRPAEVPRLSALLVSHLHPDHFDPATLRRLDREALLVLPEGEELERDLPQRQRPLAAWEAVEVQGLRITAVPAHHTHGRFTLEAPCGRAPAGYVIEGAGRAVYFAGDTGFDAELFREIARRFPRLELALLPIAPARGHNPDHLDPGEALEAFALLGARFFLPIHFEAFHSMIVPLDEPRALLAAEAQRRGLGGRVVLWRPGERVAFPQAGPRILPEREAGAASAP